MTTTPEPVLQHEQNYDTTTEQGDCLFLKQSIIFLILRYKPATIGQAGSTRGLNLCVEDHPMELCKK